MAQLAGICQTESMSKSAVNIDKLSAAERLDLLEQLWDSLSDEDVPITNAQRQELDRRLDALEQEGPVGVPWEQVRDELSDSSE
jgi:putative addiction module component (TIGR02574 family)